MNIISIQSSVALGHAGNSAAVFPLQRMGNEVWPIYTVQFSNHTGYGAWRGEVFSADHIRDVALGIEERGAFPLCDAVLSGYLGDASTGEAILAIAERVRTANPKAVYCCDPVMGDVGRGVYVRPGIPEFIAARVIPAADIMTPNHFELELLTGQTIRTLDEAVVAANTLRAKGPSIVMLTSLLREDRPENTVETMVVSPQGAWVVRTPYLPMDPPVTGTGDVIAALFLGRFLKSHDPAASVSFAVSALYGMLSVTAEGNHRELQLVSAQDEIITPTYHFSAESV